MLPGPPVSLAAPMVNLIRFFMFIVFCSKQFIKAIRYLFSFFRKMESSSSVNAGAPAFDPLKPSAPVSYPINNLEDLESRSYFESFHFPFNKATVPLPSASISLPARSRILVCHDMAGGYLDDKWIQGGSNSEGYTLWHWYLMDVFVYFSHTLVTIPPPCWINTAHTHGVKVLGTFITEWEEGKVVCNKLLSSKESAQMYAERLAELADALGFDGWLINVENKLDLWQVPILKEFVGHLTKAMHTSVAGSLVIWYDAVTTNGHLKWQDQLNEYNKPFFDLCDGIFVNYTWKANYPTVSAAASGERKFDVYMGIDVFGRNTYGGGQWNIKFILDLLKKDGVSAAIFAPGWVYETKQPPDFQTAQRRWWGLIEQSWGILQFYPKDFPFYSNFDQGHGYHFSIEGKQVGDDPWYNISCQSFQPVLNNHVDSTPNTLQALVNFEDPSYSGGGNITFKGTLEDGAYFTVRLFCAELTLADLPVHFAYSVRSDGSSSLGLVLKLVSSTSEKKAVLLASRGSTLETIDKFSSKFNEVIMPLQVRYMKKDTEAASGWVIHETSIAMNGYTLTEIGVVCYKLKPEFNGLRLQQDHKSEDEATKLVTGPSEYHASLGHISITNYEQKDFPPSTSWEVKGQYVTWASNSEGARTVSIKIMWKLKDGESLLFPKYFIYVEKIAENFAADATIEKTKDYLGVAQVQAFYVSDCVVPQGISSLKFFIQVCRADGVCLQLDNSPALLLGVEGT